LLAHDATSLPVGEATVQSTCSAAGWLRRLWWWPRGPAADSPRPSARA